MALPLFPMQMAHLSHHTSVLECPGCINMLTCVGAWWVHREKIVGVVSHKWDSILLYYHVNGFARMLNNHGAEQRSKAGRQAGRCQLGMGQYSILSLKGNTQLHNTGIVRT